MQPDRLQEAKEALPFLALWARYGLPPHPERQGNCFHPFKVEERSKSFSVYWDAKSGDHKWNDFSTRKGGDVVSFFAEMEGLTNKDAIPLFIEMALPKNGSDCAVTAPKPKEARTPAIVQQSFKDSEAEAAKKRELSFEAIELGTPADTRTVCDSRNVPFSGGQLMFTRGLLRYGIHRDCESWIVTDNKQRVAECRRMDGKHYPTKNGNGVKGLALHGSKKDWPIGIMPTFKGSQAFDSITTILFVEGQPDLLSAHGYIAEAGRSHNTIAVAMLGAGAGNKIHPDALERFKGRHVRFFPHVDSKGQGMDAVRKWARQVEDAGCASFDAYNFDGLTQADGTLAGDLNDTDYMEARPTNIVPT